MRLKHCLLPVALGGICTFSVSTRLWSQQPHQTGDASALPDAPGGQNQSASSSTNPPPQSGGTAAEDPPAGADINGTVTDSNRDVVPGATVEIRGTKNPNRQFQVANDSGFFEFKNVPADDTYRVTASAKGFDPWVSDLLNVRPGQYFDVTGITLKLAGEVSSVTVVADPVQIATEQVRIAEQQRIFGIIPNFYVVYDSRNAVPMTTKLKFQMALRVSVDPVTILGVAVFAALDQAGNTPDYQQGWKGYGQRFGVNYADGLTDVMFGGAILPSLLHQDPRYFYQGTGTVKSRLRHALANPFICRGDNGKNQINISSMGGDLISSSISNAYYPDSNRGVSLVFTNFALSTAERELSSVVQEFVLRKLTPSAKRQAVQPQP